MPGQALPAGSSWDLLPVRTQSAEHPIAAAVDHCPLAARMDRLHLETGREVPPVDYILEVVCQRNAEPVIRSKPIEAVSAPGFVLKSLARRDADAPNGVVFNAEVAAAERQDVRLESAVRTRCPTGSWGVDLGRRESGLAASATALQLRARGAAMSDGTTNLGLESTGGVVAPKLPGGRRCRVRPRRQPASLAACCRSPRTPSVSLHLGCTTIRRIS
ncbi:MAG: MgtC/SapB family protein [Mycobacterium sp.]|jgi:hypothetical protein|nr:MgtC/SapB family protein [Mycobacterium sp.]